MAKTRKKFFYPPRPGNGAGTFSDNIVGLQTVNGGGLTQGNFEFTTGVTEKVNRTFEVGAFSEPITLDNLGIDNLIENQSIISKNFSVYPNYDVSQVLNFSMYGSLSKRFGVSVTKIINYFPAALDVTFISSDFKTGETAQNIFYDSVLDETYFEVNIERINNPFDIDYSTNADINIQAREFTVSPYRNLTNTFLDYCISINDNIYRIVSFSPSESLNSGTLAFYVNGDPFGKSATTSTERYQIRPNDFIVDKIFMESFDEVEKFLLNRLVVPEYTASFQVQRQNDYGQFLTTNVQATWPKIGPWNLDISSNSFQSYIATLQEVATDLDTYKTNLISRFLVTSSLKDFDTLGQKVEKIFQIYGRSFDQIKQFIDALAYMNSVNYNPSNDIPSELLVNLSRTLGWSSNFSPITDENFLDSIFGNTPEPTYPGYARALTPNELNYAFYRNLILNSGYLFKSKGTRRSIEFMLRLIGAPDSLIEYNENIYLADQKINLDQFSEQYARISGGTYVNVEPAFIPGQTYKIKGQTYTVFTSTSQFQSVSILESDYPIDDFGYPKAPPDTESYFFQLGAGWYETTAAHRSPDQVQLTGAVFTGQNYNIQTQLTPFTYGQLYLDRFRDFPYMTEGFKLRKVVDNKKSWLDTDNRLRISTDGDYNAYYYVEDERLVLNVKNIDLYLNPAQGLVYDVWEQSRRYDYPIPESGLSINYPVPGGVDSTFINPEPKKKTFFEFAQTFWENTINVRNRQYITDGKTGGYPTLQSIFWKYLEQEETIGIPNNKYTYQKLIDYINGIGPYWMKLVDQMIPATTIWNTGVKLENSVFNRQKFVYRRQRGCQFVPTPVPACLISDDIFNYSCLSETVDFSIFPWLNGDINVSNFSSILSNVINQIVEDKGIPISLINLDSILTDWYIDLRAGEEIIILEQFYNGYGQTDVPTNNQWRNALISYLPNLTDYGFTYYLDGNNLRVKSTTCESQNMNKEFILNVGINVNLNFDVEAYLKYAESVGFTQSAGVP